MAQKSSLVFLCSSCDAQFPKWSGRCGECGAWGSLSVGAAKKIISPSAAVPAATVTPLADIESAHVPRMSTGIGELDQVLGGGIVPGSLILIGGEPGVGKSTVLAQISLSLSGQGKSVLYCSGEESGHQIKLRFDRLAREATIGKNILFSSESDIDAVCSAITSSKPSLAIIDSIQTVATGQVDSEAGSVAQVRACTVKCLETAKKYSIPLIITGHVTKDGTVAGPKTLEHLVDTVLYLEGDGDHYFRILRTVKNRFGSTNEIGVFEMSEQGLREVTNPSELFLSSSADATPGSAIAIVLEGSRAFLVTVQALTSKTYFGNPARRAVGFDLNRLQLLIAVLGKRRGLNLGDQDIHVNLAGGMRVSEPALDLSVCASIISAYSNTCLPARTALFGEIGLTGEVRPVGGAEKRIKEAEKLGMKTIIMPDQKGSSGKLELVTIKNIKELDLG